MTKLDLLWMNWTHIDNITGCFVLNDNAPKEAIESYAHYRKQIIDIDKRTKRSFIVYKSAEGEQWCNENYFDTDYSHETEHYIIYVIPYEEFCALRKLEDIDELLDEYESKHLSTSKIKHFIKLLEKNASDFNQTINMLDMALKYNTYISFGEDHII